MARDKRLNPQNSVPSSQTSPQPLSPSPWGCELHEPVWNPKSLFMQHHRCCWDSPAFISWFSF